MSELVRAISEAALRMETNEKVDESVFPLISQLREFFVLMQERLVADTTRRTREVFLPYLAAKNAESMLSKMGGRFELSLKTHTDNPTVAKDAIELMPLFANLCLVLDQFEGGPRGEYTSELLEAVRKLRVKASETQFLPSINEELSGLDMKAFARNAEKLARAVGS